MNLIYFSQKNLYSLTKDETETLSKFINDNDSHEIKFIKNKGFIKYFSNNYKKLEISKAEKILERLSNQNFSKKYIAKILFENFNLLTEDVSNKLLLKLIDSENKIVYYYLSEILYNFDKIILNNTKEKIINKLVNNPYFIDKLFDFIEDKLFLDNKLIDIFYKFDFDKNVINKIVKKIFSNFDKINENVFNYIIYLSNEDISSKYIAWHFVKNFNSIDSIYRERLLNNLFKSDNKETIETLILSTLGSNLDSKKKVFLLLNLLKNKVSYNQFAKVLSKHFYDFEKDTRNKILIEIYSLDENFHFVLKMFLKGYRLPDTINEFIMTKTSSLLDSSLSYGYIEIEEFSKKICKEFDNIPEHLKEKIVKILFENIYSRRWAINIIVKNSKSLSDNVNLLMIELLKENNYLIEDYDKHFPLHIKETIIKDIIGFDDKYKEINLEKISIDDIFKYSINCRYIKDVNSSIESYIRTFKGYNEELKNEYLIRFKRINTQEKYKRNIDKMIKSAIISYEFHKQFLYILENKLNLSDRSLFLPIKISFNKRCINTIVMSLKLDSDSFDEKVRDELMLSFLNYKDKEYILHFVNNFIRFNIHKLSTNTISKIIEYYQISSNREYIRRIIYEMPKKVILKLIEYHEKNNTNTWVMDELKLLANIKSSKYKQEFVKRIKLSRD